MYLHKSWVGRNSHFFQPAAYASANTAQYVLSLHSHKITEWCQVQWGPYVQSWSPADCCLSVLTQGLALPRCRTLHSSLLHFIKILLTHYSSWLGSLGDTHCSSQFGVIRGLTEGSLRPVIMSWVVMVCVLSLPFVNPRWLFAVAIFPFMCSETTCMNTCSLIFARTEGILTVFQLPISSSSLVSKDVFFSYCRPKEAVLSENISSLWRHLVRGIIYHCNVILKYTVVSV